MIHMMKLHVGLLIVICTVEFIDASCLSYGHSCWGAHGKRSNMPERESKQVELNNDRWALFKISPERNQPFKLMKLFRGSLNQQQYPENEINSLNSPMFDQLPSSIEENNLSEPKELNRNIDDSAQDNSDYHLKQLPMGPRLPYDIKPFQLVRQNKPNFEQ